MTIRPADLLLPPEATRLDRWTLAVWRFWDSWLQGAMSLARSVALGIVIVASVAWFVFDGSQMGVFGAVIAGAIVVGVAGGTGVVRPGRSEKGHRSPGQILVAVMIGVPLSLLLLWIGLMLSLLVISFLVVPVVNYPWLAIVVVPGAVAVGMTIRRIREKKRARYP